MSRSRVAGAVALGLLLATFPFVRYGAVPVTLFVAAPGSAHADHEPHHGGQLGMAGEHHIEVRRHGGLFEVFVSDAWRQPVRARSAWLDLDQGGPMKLEWANGRFVGPDRVDAAQVGAIVLLPDETRLAIQFDLGRDRPRPAIAEGARRIGR